MDIKRPIFWHQGLFLQPQHFQLSDLYDRFLLSPVLRLGLPHFWGVASIELSAASIANRVVDVTAGQLLFRDGTYVEVPGNAILGSRSFEGALREGERPFTVYLGIKKLSATEANVAVVKSFRDMANVSARFVTLADPEEVRDLYQADSTAQVKSLTYVVKIFWESEIEHLDDYETIPVARLERDGDVIKLSGRYVPPCVTISASPRLTGLVKDIRDELAGRARQLEEYKSPLELQKAEFDATYMLYLMALRSLNRYVPVLFHYVEAQDVHPMVVYGCLRQIIGELSSFSERYNMLGVGRDGGKGVPPYDHVDLGGCLTAAREMITALLNEITIGPEFAVRLQAEEGMYAADLQAGFFGPRNRYYLVLRTELEPERVLQSFLADAKLGSRNQMSVLIGRSLPGVELIHLPVAPQGLPRRPASLYFRVEQFSEPWERVEKDASVALYWGESPTDLKVELIAVRR